MIRDLICWEACDFTVPIESSRVLSFYQIATTPATNWLMLRNGVICNCVMFIILYRMTCMYTYVLCNLFTLLLFVRWIKPHHTKTQPSARHGHDSWEVLYIYARVKLDAFGTNNDVVHETCQVIVDPTVYTILANTAQNRFCQDNLSMFKL